MENLEKRIQEYINPRPYVGHHDEQRVFWETLKLHQQTKNYTVLFFHGIGGIGKSGLISHLINDLQMKSKDINTYDDFIVARLNFEDSSYGSNWLNGLERIRNQLVNKYQVSFPTYDVAYYIYLNLTEPRLQLKANNSNFIQNSDLLIGFLQFVDKYGPEEASEYWGVAKLLSMMAKYFDKNVVPKFNQWWKVRGNKELSVLSTIDEPHRIAELLPHFFALDIKGHLRNDTNQDQQVVFFIDTYEKLRNDEWVYTLVKKLPEVTWIFAGQKKLDWEKRYPQENWTDYLKHHPVGELSESDAKNFMASCQVTDQRITERIISIYQGIPYYLNLLVDIYQRVRETRTPQLEDFPEQHDKINERFLRHLSDSEQEAFKILSCLQGWDSQILLALLSEFNIGEPTGKIRQLIPRFSFVNIIDDRFVMHKVMQDELYRKFDTEDADYVKQIHKFCYHYFEGFCTDALLADQRKFLIKQAVYHGLQSLPSQEIYTWIRQQGKLMNLKVHYAFFISVLEQIRSALENVNESLHLADCLNWLGAVYCEQGELPLAENCLHKSLDMSQDHPEASLSDIITTKQNLASVKVAQYQVDQETETLLQDILDELNGSKGSTSKLIHTLSTYAGYLVNNKVDYFGAEKTYRKALSLAQRDSMKGNLYVVRLLSDFGLFLTETEKFSEALLRFIQALGINMLEVGAEDPRTAINFNNIGYLFMRQGKFAYAELFFNKTISLYQNLSLVEHQFYAKAIFNLGRLYFSQYGITGQPEQLSRAEEKLKQALGIQEKLPQTNYDIALTLDILGNIMLSRNRLSEAEELFRRSLAIRNRVVDIKLHPSKINVLINLYQLLFSQNKPAAAEPLAYQAYQIRKVCSEAINFTFTKEALLQHWHTLKGSIKDLPRTHLTTTQQSTEVLYKGEVSDRHQYEIDHFYHIPNDAYVIEIKNLSSFAISISVDGVSADINAEVAEDERTYLFNGYDVNSRWVLETNSHVSEDDFRIRFSYSRVSNT